MFSGVKGLYLPFQTNTLTLSESKVLTGDLLDELSSEHIDVQINAVRRALVFLLSVKESDLEFLFVTLQPQTTEPAISTYFVSEHVLCVMTQKAVVDTDTSQFDDSLLCEHKNYVTLHMPIEIGNAIAVLFKKLEIKRCNLNRLESLITSGNADRHKENDAKCRQAFKTQLVVNSDQTTANLLTCSPDFFASAHQFYESQPNSELNNVFTSTAKQVGFSYFPKVQVESSNVGSKLVAKPESLKNKLFPITSKIQSLLNSASAWDKNTALDQVLEVYNSLTSYTLLMLIVSSGHRQANPYSFSFHTMSNDFLLLRDKDARGYTNLRILPISPNVKVQINEFRKWCRKLSYHFHSVDRDIEHRLMKLGCSEPIAQPEFQLLSSKLKWYSPNFSSICESLSLDLNLPANFPRHLLATQLRLLSKEIKMDKRACSAEYFLGHTNYFSHPLSYFSPHSLADLTPVTQVIDSMMDKIGLETIANPAARGKKNQHRGQATDIIYTPFSKKYSISMRQRAYKWVTELKLEGTVLSNIVSYFPIILQKEEERLSKVRAWGVFDEEGGGYQLIQQDSLNKFIGELQGTLTEENNELALATSSRAAYQLKLNRLKLRILTAVSNRSPQKGKKLVWSNGQSRQLSFKDDACLQMKIASQLTSLIIQHLKSVEKTRKVSLLDVTLSLIVNTKKRVRFTEEFVTALRKKWNFYEGVAWLEWAEDKEASRLLVDSVTTSLKNLLDTRQKLTSLEDDYKSSLKKWVVSQGLSPYVIDAIDSLNKLSKLLSETLDTSIPSYLRHYRMIYFETRGLSSQSSLLSFLSGKRNEVSKALVHSTDNSEVVVESVDCDLTSFDLEVYKNVQSSLESIKYRVYEAKAKRADAIEYCMLKVEVEELTDEGISVLEPTQKYKLKSVSKWVLAFIAHKLRCNDIGVSSALTYLSQIYKPLLEIAKDDDIITYNTKKWLDLFNRALQLKSNNKDIKSIAARFRDAHEYYEVNNGPTGLEWRDVIVPEGQPQNKLKENILIGSEYRQILSYLDDEPKLTQEHKLFSKVLFILWSKLGLRWHESMGLKRKEIDLKHKLINLKSNGARKLKTPNGNRKIPYGALLNEDEQQLLEALCDKESSQIDLLFEFSKHYSYDNNRDQLEALAKRVVNHMRAVTGNVNMSSHVGRKSFINHMLCLLNYTDETPFYQLQLADWLGEDDMHDSVLQHAEHFREVLTGSLKLNHKILPALSLLVGHAEPMTTIKSYSHVLDLLLHAYNEQQLVNQYSLKYIASLLENNVSEKDLSRRKNKLKAVESNKTVTFCELYEKKNFSKERYYFFEPDYSPRSGFYLDEAATLKSQLEMLQRDLQKAKACDFGAKVELFEIRRLMNILYTIHTEVGYPFAEITPFSGTLSHEFEQLYTDWFRIIQNDTFIKYCSKADKIKEIDLQALYEGWCKHYDAKHNFIIAINDISGRAVNEAYRTGKTNGLKALIELAEALKLKLVVKTFSHNRKRGATYVNIDKDNITIGRLDVQLEGPMTTKGKSQFKLFNHFVFLLVVRYMFEHYDELEIKTYYKRNKLKAL